MARFFSEKYAAQGLMIALIFSILINSFGSAITFPHFSHLETSGGSYWNQNFNFGLYTCC
jgi:uncharacterized membrane protein YukC